MAKTQYDKCDQIQTQFRHFYLLWEKLVKAPGLLNQAYI